MELKIYVAIDRSGVIVQWWDGPDEVSESLISRNGDVEKFENYLIPARSLATDPLWKRVI